MGIEFMALKEKGRNLKTTLHNFLPQLAEANIQLQKRIEQEGSEAVNIMNISTDVPKYIEMVSFT